LQEVSSSALIESISNFCAYNEATVLHHQEFSKKKDHYWLQPLVEKRLLFASNSLQAGIYSTLYFFDNQSESDCLLEKLRRSPTSPCL
jgi:hypothetical protein